MGGWEKRRGEWEEDGASEGKGRGQPLPPQYFGLEPLWFASISPELA